MAWHVARMEEGRRALKILTGKPTGKKPLGRPRRIVLYCIALYCIVLMGWSLLLNALRPF